MNNSKRTSLLSSLTRLQNGEGTIIVSTFPNTKTTHPRWFHEAAHIKPGQELTYQIASRSGLLQQPMGEGSPKRGRVQLMQSSSTSRQDEEEARFPK
jgi:hypothetical protein